MRSSNFTQTQRLKTRREFKIVLDSGIRRKNSPLVVYALPSPCVHHRLGIIASKKVGGAVTRNRVKRILRESFRVSAPHLRGAGIDFVVIARRNAPSCQTLSANFQTLLRILCKDMDEGADT